MRKSAVFLTKSMIQFTRQKHDSNIGHDYLGRNDEKCDFCLSKIMFRGLWLPERQLFLCRIGDICVALAHIRTVFILLKLIYL